MITRTDFNRAIAEGGRAFPKATRQQIRAYHRQFITPTVMSAVLDHTDTAAVRSCTDPDFLDLPDSIVNAQALKRRVWLLIPEARLECAGETATDDFLIEVIRTAIYDHVKLAKLFNTYHPSNRAKEA